MANVDSTIQIIPYYSHPHLHEVIRDNTVYDETVNTDVVSTRMPYATAVVVGADKGIDNTFVRMNDISVKKKVFGPGNYDKYGQPSMQADVLFNGHTDVWLCRVLPDNAQYANLIIMAHYRKGKVLDELNQETGKVRFEIKFSIERVTANNHSGGATKEDIIDEYAQSFINGGKFDPLTGYVSVPIAYARIVGRGKYGNMQALAIDRDLDAEKEYSVKMYRFKLIDNSEVTRITNEFSGSLVQWNHNNISTFIDDLIDSYSIGSCPVVIRAYPEYIEQMFNFYKEEIVASNMKYLGRAGATMEDIAELEVAQAVTLETFDPIFGYTINTRNGEQIPYYQNYTMPAEGGWVPPQLEVPNTAGATKPLNLRDWSSAYVGARVLVAADPLNGGHRWMYTVTNIDPQTGNILYDEGEETAIDADQYDGVNLNISIGQAFDGGSDGDFESIMVNGVKRAPNKAEMKLLLSREYVKAWRGNKDRRILSPARINIDFMFDANYNMTEDETLNIQTSDVPLYHSSTVLVDKDAAALSVFTTSAPNSLTYADLNVKKAMYDLNEFRCKNGMVVNPEHGAGTSLMLDMGLVGFKTTDASEQLDNLIGMMEQFDKRQTSIDMGYYNAVDPYTGKRVPVTIMYHIAADYVNHIMTNGLNKPYTYKYSRLYSMDQNLNITSTNMMVRDSFKPEIDLIDWDVKEKLYKARINYWEITDEGRCVHRCCQNTRQRDASALLEENNVRILNTLKKNLEKSIAGTHYEWNEPAVRKGFTDAHMQIYKPWIGTMVQDLSIYFEANEWERKRMIMHCYVSVKFRDIIKRIILEININPSTSLEEE